MAEAQIPDPLAAARAVLAAGAASTPPQPSYVLDVLRGVIPIAERGDALLRAVAVGCDAMLTHAHPVYGYEVSLAPPGLDADVHHGQHPTDPRAALDVALAAYAAARATSDGPT